MDSVEREADSAEQKTKFYIVNAITGQTSKDPSLLLSENLYKALLEEDFGDQTSVGFQKGYMTTNINNAISCATIEWIQLNVELHKLDLLKIEGLEESGMKPKDYVKANYPNLRVTDISPKIKERYKKVCGKLEASILAINKLFTPETLETAHKEKLAKDMRFYVVSRLKNADNFPDIDKANNQALQELVKVLRQMGILKKPLRI